MKQQQATPHTSSHALPPSIPLLFLSRHILIIVILHLVIIPSDAQRRCINDRNFTSNSDFARNRALMLSSLAFNVTNSGGYYSSSVGTDPHIVYFIGLCRPDYSNDTCFQCMSSAAQDLTVQCPNQTQAFSWGTGSPPCFIRYSDNPIKGVLQLNPSVILYDAGKITMNLDQFDPIWGNWTRNLTVEASVGTPKLKFAHGTTILPDFVTLYGCTQCSPDLSQTNCDSCLMNAIDSYRGCCHGYRGGVVYVPSCQFQWQTYPFLATIPPPPPTPAPPQTAATASPLPSPPKGKKSNTEKIVIIAVVSTVSVMLIICVLLFIRSKRSRYRRQTVKGEATEGISTVESLQFNLSMIRDATDDFSNARKLGQGGFGAVYLGRLYNGQEIAVKRLSGNSCQGEEEFKNEVMLLARLQHRNLVRLLGFCLEGNERLLVYELVPNSSLDKFIFDPDKRACLDWDRRHKIIMGVARGLLYLHEDSRLRIIHRNLKASNILLDSNMNPKIADFGMAKLFELDCRQKRIELWELMDIWRRSTQCRVVFLSSQMFSVLGCLFWRSSVVRETIFPEWAMRWRSLYAMFGRTGGKE